jgi:hypothetical protein
MRAETGNIHTGDMKLAYECLCVAPTSPAIRAEQDFVQATSRVASFKALSTLTPAEIRYTPNKLDLVRRVLRTSDDAYRHSGIIMELTEKLGYTEPAPRAEVLSMLVDAAVAQHDWEVAREHVDAMVAMAEPDLGDAHQAETPASASKTAAPAAPAADDDEEDGWGWDEKEDEPAPAPAPPPVPAHTSTADAAKAKADAAAVRDVTYRACLALGSSDYPDLGGRLALLAQAIALAPAAQVSQILPLYHGIEAKIAADPTLLKPSSRPTSPAFPSLPSLGMPTNETMLGSRRAAKAARMAYDLGASLNLPSLRGMSVSPALGSAKSIVSPIERSTSRNSGRGSLDRPRGSFESGRSQERDAAALFDSVHGDEPSVRAGARRALVKGVGWLLGADEGEQIL